MFDLELRRQLKLQEQVHTDHLREALSVKEKEAERMLNRILSEQSEADSIKYKSQLAAIVGRLRGLEAALKGEFLFVHQYCSRESSENRRSRYEREGLKDLEGDSSEGSMEAIICWRPARPRICTRFAASKWPERWRSLSSGHERAGETVGRSVAFVSSPIISRRLITRAKTCALSIARHSHLGRFRDV